MPVRALALAVVPTTDAPDARGVGAPPEALLAAVAAVVSAEPDADRPLLVGLGSAAADPDRRWLAVDPASIGLAATGPEVVAVVAAAAGCFPRDVVVAAPAGSPALAAAAASGAAAIELGVDAGAWAAEVRTGLAAIDAAEAAARREVGVGPHPEPWPDDPRLDPALLAAGDRRNVVDRYRYWREDAIVAELDARRHPVHVAVENWRHDLNIGTVVRNANAFNVAGVHVVGERRWNRRGAMATDRYLAVHHHPSVAALVAWARGQRLPLVGIDNVPGARDLDASPLPAACVLLLGQEGAGLSSAAVAACGEIVAIGQHGSTRSLNAGVASGIALHAWAREHRREAPTWPEPPAVP